MKYLPPEEAFILDALAGLLQKDTSETMGFPHGMDGKLCNVCSREGKLGVMQFNKSNRGIIQETNNKM